MGKNFKSCKAFCRSSIEAKIKSTCVDRSPDYDFTVKPVVIVSKCTTSQFISHDNLFPVYAENSKELLFLNTEERETSLLVYL